ncbi:class I SAM-dependent DNA methyltransferase [Streptomyces sp. NPDC000133]|uniref:HsdM family class I SAM-dependent methyltransferase n=1 Tax=Streptomyces sp. NPDC000133 TaxID=3364535 RepID=UPI0036774168
MAVKRGQGGGGERFREQEWTARHITDRLWAFYRDHSSHRAITRVEFVEHIAYLLFLKMEEERSSRAGRFATPAIAPTGTWQRLTDRTGDTLHTELTRVMQILGAPLGEESAGRTTTGGFGPDNSPLETARVLFRDAKPWPVGRMAELSRLIVDEIGPYTWTQVPQAELGRAFATLLSDCREDFLANKETGQILTPPAVLTVVARALDAHPGDTVIDAAGGIGSGLVAAHQVMSAHGERVGPEAIAAADLDPRMGRLATMNILLNTGRPFHEAPPILVADSLKAKGLPVARSDRTVKPTVAICNPPFKSTGYVADDRLRSDFWAYGDFPLNFLQHIAITLPMGARAAVFVPDGVLFGGGPAATVRERLLMNCDVHTLLRLPTGIFHGTNAKSNVLFFTKAVPKPSGEPATRTLWVYDHRTNIHHTDTGNPVTEDDFADFLAAYGRADALGDREECARFRPYSVKALLGRPGTSLDIPANLSPEAEDLGSPRDIAARIADDLNRAQTSFRAVADALG